VTSIGSLGELTPLAVVLAVLGGAWGLVADRIATRWPEHDATEGFLPGRRPGWRTVVVVLFGAFGLGVLPGIFLPATGAGPTAMATATDPSALSGEALVAIFGAYVAVLVLLLATDLDQRLMPDLLTLPMIPLAFLFAVSGLNPLVGDAWVAAAVAAVVIPAVLYLPSLLFGAGAFGLGDVKLLVTVGLVSGAYRAIGGTFAGIIVAGIVIVVLLVARRVSLRSYVPFGPFLILGAVWAIVLPT